MKNNKIWTIISVIILALQAIAEVLTVAFILRLNILPEKYALLLAIVLGVLMLITGGILFIHGKKPVSIPRRIVGYILAMLVIAGCMLAFWVSMDAYRTLNKVTEEDPETSVMEMYVFVRQDDPAQSLLDAKDYSFAIVEDYDVDHTQQAIVKIGEVIGNTPVIAQYDSASSVADALFGGQVDAVVLNGVAVAILLEQEGYEDFMEKARILCTMELADLEETEPTTEETTEETTAPSKDVVVVPQKPITEGPFIAYVSGSDTRNKKLRTSRSDVNILVVVNPQTKQVLLLNTPRDYYVPNPAGKGALDKLTHCGLYGVKNSMKALGDLYGLDVRYYAQINFTGFETLVDAVGGVTVYSDQKFSVGNIHFVKGDNELNGVEALAFARERHHVRGGDNGRGRHQMEVIKALIKKMTTGTTIISNYTKIMDSLSGMFKTNVTTEEISLLVKMQLEDMATWNVQTFAATGTGASKPSYSSPKHNAYVMYPNKKVVAYASELANKVLNGEILTSGDMKVPK